MIPSLIGRFARQALNDKLDVNETKTVEQAVGFYLKKTMAAIGGQKNRRVENFQEVTRNSSIPFSYISIPITILHGHEGI